MAIAKTRFLRNELLIVQPYTDEYRAAGEYIECYLCRARGWRDELVHDSQCLLADDSVTSVILVKERASVVLLRQSFGNGRRWRWRWRWRKYYIEKVQGQYTMFDTVGNPIVIRRLLRDIRRYIINNQGRLLT